MRIGILEWICGGGLQVNEPALVAKSLLNEGQAMLNAVAQDLIGCGHEVTANIDARLFDRSQFSEFGSRFHTTYSSGFTKELPSGWWKIASEADAALVIAPELSGILQTAISRLAPVCKLLLNCKGEFLAASCDKWLTAERLRTACVNHPATQLACDATESWLQQHRNQSGKWIIKPRDGAGCEAIHLAGEKSVQDALNAIRPGDSNSRMIIQPLHTGTSFSRSAIVDSAGCPHWLPLVTQEFTVGDSMTYCGGRVLSAGNLHFEDTLTGSRYSIERLDEVLNATLGALGQGALGWVGVDLVYNDELNDWMVIEINPRLTTSFSGLSMSHGPGLMERMLQAAQGIKVAIDPTWKTIAFNAAGKPL